MVQPVSSILGSGCKDCNSAQFVMLKSWSKWRCVCVSFCSH